MESATSAKFAVVQLKKQITIKGVICYLYY
jgi:hypothetical protein